MKTDVNQYKIRLLEYLQAKNIFIDTSKAKPLARCINPSHDDANPSMTIYDDQFNCNSCACKGDIFDAAGLLTGAKDFPDKLKEVESVLGIAPTTTAKPKRELFLPTVIPLERGKALKIYTDESVLKFAHYVVNGKDIKPSDPKYRKLRIPEECFFPYYDKNGLIDLMVIRFEDEAGKKEVLSFYWNGEGLRMKSYPILLFNRHSLAKTDKPIIIHEGEKYVNIAEEKLPQFTHTAWNGGGKKFGNIQALDILKGKEIFLLPDDDAPGRETMKGLQGMLKGSIIIPHFTKARNKKKKGADIEEILQTYSPEEITKTILNLRPKNDNSKNISHIDNNDPELPIPSVDDDTSKMLGIADDGRAYFLDYTNRMLSYELSTLTHGKLIDIFGLQHFLTRNQKQDKLKPEEWLKEIDGIMHISKMIDFDLENCRGRGAWKDKNGNICYHDGKNTQGNYDPNWTFIRKSRRCIGLSSPDCDEGIRKEIMKICHNFSFKTKPDAMRLLSWAVLAPFGGALKWRPAILVTGESGTGKSTVLENIVHPISKYSPASGASSTEPGLRQMLANDSTSILLDEAENNAKNKDRIEAILSLMRVSTSDNAPPIIKGSTGGKSMSFTVRAMFGFSAINASIDNVADDNRIIRINFIQKNNFATYVDDYERVTKVLLTEENCAGIRAFTWRNLDKIIKLGSRLEAVIQKVTKQNARYAAGESILLAANMVVWENMTSAIDDDQLFRYVENFYKDQKQESKRDEISEMIERLLDETILYGREKERISFRKILVDMKLYLDWKDSNYEDVLSQGQIDAKINIETYREYKTLIEHYGLSVHGKTRELAIAQNHKEIMKILALSNGYHHQLERHKTAIRTQEAVLINSRTRTCAILTGFLNFEEEE